MVSILLKVARILPAKGFSHIVRLGLLVDLKSSKLKRGKEIHLKLVDIAGKLLPALASRQATAYINLLLRSRVRISHVQNTLLDTTALKRNCFVLAGLSVMSS